MSSTMLQGLISYIFLFGSGNFLYCVFLFVIYVHIIVSLTLSINELYMIIDEQFF